MRGKPEPILLIDDDGSDAIIVQRAFKELNVANELIHCINGEDALEHLRGENNKRPCVILLDLNMPKMNGIEFLKVIKTDKALRLLPVVVLTTSQDKKDVVESFEHGAAGYMVKPVDYKKFVEAVRAIDMYWTLSRLPPNDG